MSATIGWIRERWFRDGLRFFALGAMASVVLIGVTGLTQIRVIGLLALGQALVGLYVCAVGVRAVQPSRWRGVVAGMHTQLSPGRVSA